MSKFEQQLDHMRLQWKHQLATIEAQKYQIEDLKKKLESAGGEKVVDEETIKRMERAERECRVYNDVLNQCVSLEPRLLNSRIREDLQRAIQQRAGLEE